MLPRGNSKQYGMVKWADLDSQVSHIDRKDAIATHAETYNQLVSFSLFIHRNTHKLVLIAMVMAYILTHEFLGNYMII